MAKEIISQELVKSIDARFWKVPYHRTVFKLLTDGKSLADMLVEMNTTKAKLVRVVSLPSFLRRLEIWFANHTLRKEVIRCLYFEKMAERAFQSLPIVKDDTIIREFNKLLLDKEAKKILGPKITTLIMNFFKGRKAQFPSGAEAEDRIQKAFGYAETKFLEPDVKPKQTIKDSSVDQGESAPDKQTPAN